MILPAAMLVLALLVEPACMGYTLAVMRGCACELARVVATDADGDLSDCMDFARRRLRAVPEVSLFHVGGEGDWDISASQGEAAVDVCIRGHVRPLPLMGVMASAFLETDGEGVVVEAKTSERLRADWVGGSYETWQEMWGR